MLRLIRSLIYRGRPRKEPYRTFGGQPLAKVEPARSTEAMTAAQPSGPSTEQPVIGPSQQGGLQPASLPYWMGDLADPKIQMEAVAAAGFQRVRLLNKEEAYLLPLLENCVREYGTRHRLMAQVALGELIRPRGDEGSDEQRRRAYASINSKRLDFAVIDRFGMLTVAIELQGTGHFHPTSFMRDAVKREALRKAGVPLIEVPSRYKAEDVKAQMLRALKPDGPPQVQNPRS